MKKSKTISTFLTGDLKGLLVFMDFLQTIIKKLFLFLIAFLFISGVYAQFVNNQGAGIISQVGSYWVVSGGNFTLISDETGTTTFENLRIEEGATLTIDPQSSVTVNNDLEIIGTIILASNESGGASLLTNGTITGEPIATSTQRYMTGDKWHLISASMEGQDIGDLLTATENDVAKNGTNYAMMDYNESTDAWNAYFTASTPGTFTTGKGYSVRRETDGIISFIGTLPNADVSVPITQSGQGWNLIGNPYPTALGVTSNASTSDKFLLKNSDRLDPNFAALYLWVEENDYDGVRNDYKILNNAGSGSLVQDYLQLGQAFFVKSKTGGSTIDFTTNMRIINPEVAYKAAKIPWPTIKLTAESAKIKSTTTVTFNSQMTTGLDVGYDAGMFKQNTLAIYSRLVKDNGVDFALQCLPDNEYSKMVVPLGLDALAGAEIIFRAEGSNLPSNCSIILEDREKAIYTKLHETGKSYTIKLTKNLSGIGRFFLHTSTQTTSNESIQLQNIFQVIPQSNYGLIQIKGPVYEKTVAKIYDLSGKLVKYVELEQTDRNTISFGETKRGIYILQIQNTKSTVNQKILW